MIIAVIITIAIYLIVMIWAGAFAVRWVSDSADYLLAGREFGAVVNVLELCAVALAGSLLTFVPSLVLGYGLRSAVLGYIGALGLGYALYGILYGKLARDNGAQTVAEYFEIRYDANVRTLVSIASSITILGITANNVLAIGSLFQGLLGFPTFLVTSICFLVIIIFTCLSGFWGVTLTDMIQVIFGAAAFIVLCLYLIRQYGGMDFLTANFPSEDLWSVGVHGDRVPLFSLQYPSYLTLFLNYMIFILWGNNYYFLRLNTCRNGRVGRGSYVFTGLVMIPLTLTPLALIGAYAAAIHPELFGSDGVRDGSYAVASVLQQAPAVLVVFVLVSAVAVTVSTASTALIGVVSTLFRDLYQRRFNPDGESGQMLKVQKRLVLIVALLAWGLCFYPNGTVLLFGFSTSWLGPVAILMLLASFWPRFTNAGAFWGALTGMVLLTLANLLDVLEVFALSDYVHSSVLGITSTLVVGVAVSLCTKPNYYGQKGWERDPEKGSRDTVVLSRFDKCVLEMIRYGEISLAEITDYLGCDSRMSSRAVENLDRGGYISRMSRYGSGFYHLRISKLGEDVLPPLSAEEAQLRDAELSSEQFRILVQANISNEQMLRYAAALGFDSLRTTAVISLLDRRGYIRQRGFMKRRAAVTERGRHVVESHRALAEQAS